jgi:undecaprenyldiphospho-muramoylpentapeptide beta-N-acetylglucosaminyltransferase
VYPALTVLQTIASSSSLATYQVLWVGGLGGMEADLVKRLDIPFTSIPAAGVHGVGLRALPGNLVKLVQGFFAGHRILQQFHPDVVLYTGGYVAIPVALAARFTQSRSTRPASLLYVPDIEPGLALKTLARFASRIAVTSEASRAFFSPNAQIVVSGYPIRPDLGNWTRQKARQFFHLNTDLLTLLIFGGSKGARSINRAVLAILPELLAEMQVIHISGNLDWQEVETAREKLIYNYPKYNQRYHTFPYLHEEMGAALSAADLVLSRAGAATLGEFPYFGTPAILVPYPHAWHYQNVNARYLEKHGAASIVEDAELPQRILPVILDLIHNPQKREQMSRAMKSLANPQAASALAGEITALAERSTILRT